MAKYLPRGTKFKQARSLSKETIAGIFKHLVDRQELHGADDAFRFKSFKNGKGEFKPAIYNEPEVEDTEPEANDDGPTRLRRGRARGKKQPVIAGIIPPEPEVDDVEPEAAEPEINNDEPLGATRASRARTRRGKATPAGPELGPETVTEAGPGPTETPAMREYIPDHVIIDQDLATRLRDAGCPIPNAFNGPADGPPQYAIPRNTYETYEGIIRQSTASVNGAPSVNQQLCIDPALLPTPRPSPTPHLGTKTSEASPRLKPRPVRVQPGRKGK